MTFDWITRVVVSPIFFFLCCLLTILTLLSLYAAFVVNTAYIMVALILFLLAFNAFRMGWHLFVYPSGSQSELPHQTVAGSIVLEERA